MKSVLAWLGSGALAALLGLALVSTFYGNHDETSGWFGGPVVLLAFMAGALPMSMAHGVAFRYLRPSDPLRLRMIRAIGAGLLVFAAVVGALALLAHRT